MEIIFLGSGGGRWTTLTQRLRTGGIRLHGESRIHLDPGPGAIVNLAQAGISALRTDAVVVSHSHPDHYNDAEILVEAMTRGMRTTRGTFAGSRSAVEGVEDIGPVLSRYHASKVKEMLVLEPGGRVSINGLAVEALPAKHSDPTNVGLSFAYDEGVVSYISDTEYFPGMEEGYRGARVLIVNVIRPANRRIPWHLCTEDVIKILHEVRPELAILNHFGMTMIGLAETEARRVERKTGVKTIAARDFMRIDVGEEIEVQEVR
ncbi:MAG: MBL fold metallo-hydrolase [Euryarchaeota archaeon]|nr:MBL fold metallo-hydrolase [Euryarchaeota archaeon]